MQQAKTGVRCKTYNTHGFICLVENMSIDYTHTHQLSEALPMKAKWLSGDECRPPLQSCFELVILLRNSCMTSEIEINYSYWSRNKSYISLEFILVLNCDIYRDYWRKCTLELEIEQRNISGIDADRQPKHCAHTKQTSIYPVIAIVFAKQYFIIAVNCQSNNFVTTGCVCCLLAVCRCVWRVCVCVAFLRIV